MSVAKKENSKKIIEPKKMGLLVENHVYKSKQQQNEQPEYEECLSCQ